MILKIPRFWSKEMTSWPKNDALNILYFEIVLMSLFLLMNGADYALQQMGAIHYVQAGSFPISQFIAGWLPENELSLFYIERGAVGAQPVVLEEEVIRQGAVGRRRAANTAYGGN